MALDLYPVFPSSKKTLLMNRCWKTGCNGETLLASRRVCASPLVAIITRNLMIVMTEKHPEPRISTSLAASTSNDFKIFQINL
jgi:hypothetical protein